MLREISIVALRTPKRLILSVDGNEPKTVLQEPFLSLETPLGLIAGVGLKQGDAALHARIDGFEPEKSTTLRTDIGWGAAVADFDRHGFLDVLSVCDHWNALGFFQGGPDGFDPARRQEFATAPAATGARIADLDHDGRPELVFGDHMGYSEVWWNGPEGFLPTRTTKLPTRGPHGMSAIEPGNILSRGPEEWWTSAPRRVAESVIVDAVDIAAECPPKTWVKATARAAATEEALADAPWRTPEGLEVPANGFLQIRLELGATLSLSSPREPHRREVPVANTPKLIEYEEPFLAETPEPC